MAQFNYNIDTVGSGALFPIELKTSDRGLGWLPSVGDTALIENNLRSLVEYSIGQRFRQEEFGTRLWECLEDPNTQATSYIIKEFLLSAISQYESRITLKGFRLEREYSDLKISITYQIKGLNTESSMTLIYNTTGNIK